jgi:hypothetical protein
MESKLDEGGIGIVFLIFLALAGAILLKPFYDSLKINMFLLIENIIAISLQIINSQSLYLSLFFLLGILVTCIFYLIYIKIKRKKKERKEKLGELEKEGIFIRGFLRANLRNFNYEELRLKVNQIKQKILLGEYDRLNSKLEEARDVLIELKHKETLNEINYEKGEAKNELQELKQEIRNLEYLDETKKNNLKEELDIDENKVFEKSDLTKKEIEVLLEEGYRQVNEYCVALRKNITVLVKPTMNHSVTHTFLVWSTRQLLENSFGVEKIIEHETKDADLTFKIKTRTFAIEIETGTLLRKKKQLKEKMKFLNRKYGNKWLIVASKRELVRKYSRFGVCTQRKLVEKKLVKMLEM